MYCTRFLSTIVIALFIGQASAQVEFPLGSEVVNVRKAPYNVRVVTRQGQSFFSTLRKKMMWGADSRG